MRVQVLGGVGSRPGGRVEVRDGPGSRFVLTAASGFSEGLATAEADRGGTRRRAFVHAEPEELLRRAHVKASVG